MSTKKRILVIAIVHACFAILFLSFLLILSNGKNSTAESGLFWIYSLIIPIWCIIAGVITNCMSIKIGPLCFSLLVNVVHIIISMYEFAFAYKIDFGVQNLGFSYIGTASFFVLIGWLTVLIIKKIKLIIMNNTIISETLGCKKNDLNIQDKKAKSEVVTMSVNNPMVLKAYNKTTNRHEKYLIWINRKGKKASSNRIVWIDDVDLIVIDSDKVIYECNKKPKRISFEQYLALNKATNNTQ